MERQEKTLKLAQILAVVQIHCKVRTPIDASFSSESKLSLSSRCHGISCMILVTQFMGLQCNMPHCQLSSFLRCMCIKLEPTLWLSNNHHAQRASLSTVSPLVLHIFGARVCKYTLDNRLLPEPEPSSASLCPFASNRVGEWPSWWDERNLSRTGLERTKSAQPLFVPMLSRCTRPCHILLRLTFIPRMLSPAAV